MPEQAPAWSTPWGRLRLALAMLALDPGRLGGLHLRARAGPARSAALALAGRLDLTRTDLHPAMADDALFGGLDLSATLAGHAPVYRSGLLERGGLWRLTMAERATPGYAARLAARLDDGDAALLALDEGVEDETLAPCLADRLGFQVDLEGMRQADLIDAPLPRPLVDQVHVSAEDITWLAETSLQLGIPSLRATGFALAAAVAHARLSGRKTLGSDDLSAAVALCLAHRATQWPETAESEPPPEPDQPPQTDPETGDTDNREDPADLPRELLLEAVRAILPPDLLDRIAIRKSRTAAGSGSGAQRQASTHGRPLPARRGRPNGQARIDIVATLRSAAPWQPMRRLQAKSPRQLHILPSDLHLKRAQDRAERLLIFLVDASGSAALARLAEAKGAVELLLAEAYARRDHVSLIAFRGSDAELLLPPTRSLVQTKRRLAALPGGGGTPLATGLQAAADLADKAKRRGMTPTIALLTDGRANVALDGGTDRARAAEDATAMGRMLRAAGVDCIVIDTGNRPNPALATLAAQLGGPCLPMPRADAKRISAALGSALAE